MVIANSIDRTDPWPARVALSSTFQALAPAFTANDVEPFFKFLIVDQALGDRHPDVRREMLTAGTVVIDLHGPIQICQIEGLGPQLDAVYDTQIVVRTCKACKHALRTYTSCARVPFRRTLISSRDALACIDCPRSISADEASLASLGWSLIT